MPFFGGGSDPGAAKGQVGTDNSYASTFGNNAAGSWNALFPTLVQNATDPTGLSASEKANMNTASSQATGGSVAGAVGQGTSMAARTKNPGAYGAALDASSKHASETQSKNALGVEMESSNLAHQKQQTALSELGSLYGTNVKGLGEMLDAANTAMGTYEAALKNQKGGFDRFMQVANAAGDLGAQGLPF